MDSLIAFQVKHPHSVIIKQFPNHLSCFQLKHSAFENPLLPLTIRGFFIDSETKDIKIRGYNKFFMNDTTSDFIGPFEVWIKENGCLIFISLHQSSLLITTKHECQSNYTEKAKEWLMSHLERSKMSEQDLIHFLTQHQVTMAFEVMNSFLILSSVMMILKNMCWNIQLKREDCGYMALFIILLTFIVGMQHRLNDWDANLDFQSFIISYFQICKVFIVSHFC
jgi:hypothetical protein